MGHIRSRIPYLELKFNIFRVKDRLSKSPGNKSPQKNISKKHPEKQTQSKVREEIMKVEKAIEKSKLSKLKKQKVEKTRIIIVPAHNLKEKSKSALAEKSKGTLADESKAAISEKSKGILAEKASDNSKGELTEKSKDNVTEESNGADAKISKDAIAKTSSSEKSKGVFAEKASDISEKNPVKTKTKTREAQNKDILSTDNSSQTLSNSAKSITEPSNQAISIKVKPKKMHKSKDTTPKKDVRSSKSPKEKQKISKSNQGKQKDQKSEDTLETETSKHQIVKTKSPSSSKSKSISSSHNDLSIPIKKSISETVNKEKTSSKSLPSVALKKLKLTKERLSSITDHAKSKSSSTTKEESKKDHRARSKSSGNESSKDTFKAVTEEENECAKSKPPMAELKSHKSTMPAKENSVNKLKSKSAKERKSSHTKSESSVTSRKEPSTFHKDDPNDSKMVAKSKSPDNKPERKKSQSMPSVAKVQSQNAVIPCNVNPVVPPTAKSSAIMSEKQTTDSASEEIIPKPKIKSSDTELEIKKKIIFPTDAHEIFLSKQKFKDILDWDCNPARVPEEFTSNLDHPEIDNLETDEHLKETDHAEPMEVSAEPGELMDFEENLYNDDAQPKPSPNQEPGMYYGPYILIFFPTPSF